MKLTKFIKRNKAILAISIFAFILRIIAIELNPPSLNWDEVSHGYNAYSILTSGQDEWGRVLPAIFRAYGDYKLPVYIYLTAISEAIFGLNAFAVRLPSVIAGVTTVIFSYLLVKKIFDEKTALVTALLVSVEPWSLFLSRGAFEANLALAFIVSGAYFFFLGIKKPKKLFTSIILFGLSIWTYNSARIFVPIFFLLLVYLYKQELYLQYLKNKKVFLLLFVVLYLVFKPMFVQLADPEGQARYDKVAILDSGAIEQINEARTDSSLNPTLARLVHNKGTKFVTEFVSNWTKHLSGEFLYFEGGTQFQFSVPGRGVLFLIGIPFLIIGLYDLLLRKDKKAFVVLGWFFFGPIASSLTREAPHVLRAITMLPAPMIITSVGLTKSWELVKKRYLKKKVLKTLLLGGFLLLLTGSLESYLLDYFTDYRKDYSWSWQYGYKQVVNYTIDNYKKYDRIIITKKYGEPHEFFLFYWLWNPATYRNDPNLIRFSQSDWFWVDRFDKFYFVNDWDIPEGGEEFVLESDLTFNCSDQDCLLITSPGNYPENWDLVQTINFLDEKPAFEIYRNKIVVVSM